MHILLIHQSFAALDEPGGTRHHELARYLSSQGHQVTVIASPVSYLTGTTRQGRLRWRQEEVDEGVTILRTYTYPALHRSFVARVFSFLSFMVSSFIAGLSVRDVDLVWGTSPPIFQGLTAWALGRLKKVPFLFEVRDLWPIFAIQVGVLRNQFLIRASEWLERFLYSHADRVMVNSPGFSEHVTRRGARCVELVPNGADPRMFDLPSDGSEVRRENGWQDRFVALYAGAHGMSNDLGVVLEAASLLRDHSEIQLVLLGDGKEKPALMQRAREMSLENLSFLPSVPKMEMPAVLAASDACIAILKPIPMYATVYPNKVFDYMAAGKPVVLAIRGVIQDVIEQSGGGIPIPPGDSHAMADAILRLSADRDTARQMGRQGRSYLESHFDRALLSQKLAHICQEMIAAR